MNEFAWPVRVYYEDTDAGGVVYHANYLQFMERARTEWLRSLGFEQDVLRDEGLLFAVKHIDIDYRLPAFFNQQLTVMTGIAELGRASLSFAQNIFRGETCLIAATVQVVSVDTERFKPKGIPVHLREVMQSVG